MMLATLVSLFLDVGARKRGSEDVAWLWGRCLAVWALPGSVGFLAMPTLASLLMPPSA